MFVCGIHLCVRNVRDFHDNPIRSSRIIAHVKYMNFQFYHESNAPPLSDHAVISPEPAYFMSDR